MTTKPDRQEPERKKKKVSVNQITLKSRKISPILNGEAMAAPDLTLPRANRPMCGLDLEEWRGMLQLTKFDAEAALGFRSTTLYNRECSRKVLPVRTEILLRLYDEKPENYPWKSMTFKELFNMMYAKYIDQFGPDLQGRARNDLEARFTVLFGRSPSRGYAWLRGDDSFTDEGGAAGKASSYATIERILQKLTQWSDPGAAFERIASHSLRLRGVNIDDIFPIPTLARPPQRARPGRRPDEKKLASEAERKLAAERRRQEARERAAAKLAAAAKAKKAAAAQKAAAKKAAAKKAPGRKAAAKKTAAKKAPAKPGGAAAGARPGTGGKQVAGRAKR